jgi:hypothetical protein
MSFHSCWVLKPKPGEPFLAQAEVLDRLAVAFPVHEFDAEGARAAAAKRLEILEKLGAPEVILDSYRGAPPVGCRIAEAADARFSLQFAVWPDQAIMVSFANELHFKACFFLLDDMAELLGYELEEDTEAS